MPQFASAAVSAQPDWVALAMVLALALFVAVMTVRKYLSKKNKAQAVTAAPAAESTSTPAAASVQVPAAPGSAGHLKIHDVPPKTAAMLMAITADKLGKPLNELRFISIKEVK